MARGGGPPQRNHGDMGETFVAAGAPTLGVLTGVGSAADLCEAAAVLPSADSEAFGFLTSPRSKA